MDIRPIYKPMYHILIFNGLRHLHLQNVGANMALVQYYGRNGNVMHIKYKCIQNVCFVK